MSATRWAGIPPRRSCRRCSRWRRRTAVDGRAFIAAYVAGFETETRIARGVNFHHYEKGWHPTATLGVFGATAACCQLLGLPVDRTALALGTGGVVRIRHQGEFRHHDQAAACRACRAQRLAGGVAGGGRVHRQSRRVRASAGLSAGVQRRGQFRRRCDRCAIGASPWDIVQPGVGIKQYPCCGSTHSGGRCDADAGARA